MVSILNLDTWATYYFVLHSLGIGSFQKIKGMLKVGQLLIQFLNPQLTKTESIASIEQSRTTTNRNYLFLLHAKFFEFWTYQLEVKYHIELGLSELILTVSLHLILFLFCSPDFQLFNLII